MGPSRRRSYKLGLALRFHGPWVPRYEQQGPKNDKVKVSKNEFLLWVARFESFRIIQSFRFYVKSILENVEVLKTTFFISEFSNLVNFGLQKVQKFIKNHNSELLIMSK